MLKLKWIPSVLGASNINARTQSTNIPLYILLFLKREFTRYENIFSSMLSVYKHLRNCPFQILSFQIEVFH